MASRSNSLLVLVLIFFSLTSEFHAQTGQVVLVVTVKDQFEGTVAEADIELRRSDSKVRAAKSDVRGAARFAGVSAGDYEISVAAAGFKEHKGTVQISGGRDTQRIEIVLDVAPIETAVDVGENESATPESAGAALVLNEDQIDKLPEDQEELERAIRRLGETVGGEELPVSVNGVQGAKIPPKAAIQQIRVNQNVFSAQYDNPFGGGIDIFTRSNVDRFRQYVSFTFADSRLNAADPFIARRVPYQSRSYFYSLSGPLFGKKANFYSSISRSESDSSSTVNAIVLDADLRPTAFREFFAAPSRSHNASFIVNADPNKKHKLYFSYNVSASRNDGQNVGGFSLPSRANEGRSSSHFIQFSDTYLANPNVVSQTRLLASYTSAESFGGDDAAAVNVLEAFFGGGSQQNRSDRNLRLDAGNDTTWQMGRYALGFGFRLRTERVNQTSTANYGGTFTFSGREAPVLDANDQPVTNPDGSFVTTRIDSLASYRRTLLFAGRGLSPLQIRQLGGGASQFTISGGDPELKASQTDFAVYVQNSYRLTETIAASFGVRYENQTNIRSLFNLAPRFGLIWAPKAKDKQNPLYTLPRISIGYGLFYSRFALGNTLGIRLASDPGRRQYLITEGDILDIYPNVPTVELLEQFALPRTQRFIADGFETPYQSQLSITAMKRMPKGFNLSLVYSRSVFSRQANTLNINAPLPGTFDPLDPTGVVRPLGNVGNIYESRSTGKTEGDRFSMTLTFPQSQKMFGNLRYSYGRSKSSVTSGSGSPFDPYDFSQEFGPTAFDGVHSGGGFFYYTFPRKISLGSDFSISSGSRFNITTGRDTNGDGFYNERPAFATDPNKPGVVATPYGLLDPNPLPGDKLIPRNLGRGSAVFQWNASLSKTFGFNADVKNKKPAKQTLVFSIRVNNLFNIINKGNPVGNMSSPNFLRSLSGFSDGGILIINGAQQVNFPGRSMSLSAAFGF